MGDWGGFVTINSWKISLSAKCQKLAIFGDFFGYTPRGTYGYVPACVVFEVKRKTNRIKRKAESCCCYRRGWVTISNKTVSEGSHNNSV